MLGIASLLLGAGSLSTPGLEAQVQRMGERAPLGACGKRCSALLSGLGNVVGRLVKGDVTITPADSELPNPSQVP